MPQYNPKEVSISWNGISLNEGIAEGSFINAERTNPDWTDSEGSDGEYTRIATGSEKGVVTLTLTQSSKTNALLDAILQADKFTANAVGGISIKDNQGNSKVTATTAYLEGPPPFERSNGITTNAWRFLCGSLKIRHKGNADVPSAS